MTDDGKTGEHRRVKLLVEQPVTDHMLDVVAHLRQHDHEEISPVITMVQRRESDLSLDRVDDPLAGGSGLVVILFLGIVIEPQIAGRQRARLVLNDLNGLNYLNARSVS